MTVAPLVYTAYGSYGCGGEEVQAKAVAGLFVSR